ncbi:hypothetical protein [Acidovorax sp. SDU_ACID1]|uniref:hypothetical protein n=1 Tax=Acidovorax sp. SDU_ACID1 TaxID=3136632 RepID=UPI003873AA3B
MTLKTTQLTAITAASCSAKPASCDAAAITLKQVCSDHGFDDYDVAGHPEIYRVCVGHGLKHGDVFNVYGPAGKRGATWCGNLEASLARSLCVNADIVGVADPQALSRHAGSPVAAAPLSTICPNHRYCLLDDGMGELAFVSAGAWAAAMYHADSGAGADSLCVSRSRST